MSDKVNSENRKLFANNSSNRSSESSKDTLFAAPIGDIQGFSFDQQVADVFPDMLQRSIPGYQTIIAQTGLLSGRFAQPSTRCYDLGCSLGATTFALRSHIPRSCQLTAVDNSSAMLNRLSERLAESVEMDDQCPVELRCEDIVKTNIQNASVVAMNFTLQFIASEQRLALMRRIYDGMTEGSILILSEKVVFDDPDINKLYIEQYHNFKRANGYSDLEISQKRTALENVLIPETLETHQCRLRASGFHHISIWFQCYNFISLMACK